MTGVIYIRDVDDETLNELKRQAAEARMSLSAYAGQQLAAIARMRRQGSSGMGAKIREAATERQARGATTPTTEEIVAALRTGRQDRSA